MTSISKEAIDRIHQLIQPHRYQPAHQCQEIHDVIRTLFARVQELEAVFDNTAKHVIDVSILTMRLSGNRQEHWVRITCDDRTFDVRRYGGEYLNRAEYERDMLRHVFLNELKPNLMDPKYKDPAPQPETQPD